VFDVIDALAVLGADADLVGVSSTRLDAMLQRAGADAALRAALLAGDADRLETLLRAPKTLCIFIHPAEEEEEDPEDEEEDEDADDDDEGGEDDGDDDDDLDDEDDLDEEDDLDDDDDEGDGYDEENDVDARKGPKRRGS